MTILIGSLATILLITMRMAAAIKALRVTTTRREGRKLLALKDLGGWNEYHPWRSAGFLAMRFPAAMRSSSWG
jgi:hypothetical protein